MTDFGGARYSDSSVEAIVHAYYARATASPDTARGRAQAAYGIATAVAGGLVAAAVISRLPSVPDSVQLLGVVAVALWLAATSLYLYAVAVPVQLPSSTSQPRGSTEFVDAVIERAVTERKTVDTRQTRANVASAVAMVATLATFALAMFLPAETFSASVSVSPTSGLTSTACLRQPHVIKGDVVASSVQSNLVEIRRATVCGDTIETLYVDRQRIIEVRVTE